METEHRDRTRRPWWQGLGGSFVLWPVMLLCLYVLSIGPVAKLNQQRLIRREAKAVVKFYTPLMWAVTRSPTLSGWLDWYLIKVWRM